MARQMEEDRERHEAEVAEKQRRIEEERQRQEEEAARLREDLARVQRAAEEDRRRAEELEALIAKEWPRPSWHRQGVPSVCVSGRTGTGKSTFINCALGKRPGDLGAAPVGVGETTMVATPYEVQDLLHPLRGLVLYDLPGAGTASFPAITYIKEMGIRYCSVVVIMTAGRVEETDLALFREARRWEIPAYLVRNKVNQDIRNNEDDKDVTPLETLKEIRENMVKEASRHPQFNASDVQRIFLLSAKTGCFDSILSPDWARKGPYDELLEPEMKRLMQMVARDFEAAYA